MSNITTKSTNPLTKVGSILRKSLPLGGAFALVISMTPSTLAATLADFIFVVDESGSMAGEHAWLGSIAQQLDTALGAKGVTARYGLVGFGNSGNPHGNRLGHKHLVGGNEFGTAAQFSTATNSLVVSGGFEDGYSAINTSLSYNFRANAATNIILVTDEDRDNGNTSLTFNSILGDLQSDGAVLNAVVNANFTNNAIGTSSKNTYVADGTGGFTTTSGAASVTSDFGNTDQDYVQLALQTGGAAWNLNKLRAGGVTADSFSQAFVDIKVEEIINTPTPVPEPITIFSSILALGFGAACVHQSSLKRSAKAARA